MSMILDDEKNRVMGFITVTHGCRGYFPAIMSWEEDPDEPSLERDTAIQSPDGFYEPQQSYPITIKGTREEAKRFAREWSECEECPLLEDGNVLYPIVGSEHEEGFEAREFRCVWTRSRRLADDYAQLHEHGEAIFDNCGKLISEDQLGSKLNWYRKDDEYMSGYEDVEI